jgi:predicted lipoprotein with Yx(FWY)xxD motif
MVTSNQSFGQIVTTGAGRTVYRYDLDTANAAKSACTGACASLWAPVMAPSSGAPELSGISASAVGTTTSATGGKQLTLAGWPLYTYVGDTAAGQATGQASGGTWWVVSPTGAKITTAAAGGASSSDTGTTTGSGAGTGAGGYGY